MDLHDSKLNILEKTNDFKFRKWIWIMISYGYTCVDEPNISPLPFRKIQPLSGGGIQRPLSSLFGVALMPEISSS